MTMEAWGQAYKPNQDWNHAWGTAPANAIVRYVAGIQPLTPGYGEVQIRPQPGNVQQVDLKLRTIKGDISVKFHHEPDTLHLRLSLPGNTTGQVYLPFNTKKAVVKMNGKIVHTAYADGYFRVRPVEPGVHDFEVYLADRP